MIAGQLWNTQMSVMPALGLTTPGFTFGAGPSNNTRERPCASLPVTTRRMGFRGRVMGGIAAGRFYNCGGETGAQQSDKFRRRFILSP
jgi:hypothetical protein